MLFISRVILSLRRYSFLKSKIKRVVTIVQYNMKEKFDRCDRSIQKNAISDIIDKHVPMPYNTCRISQIYVNIYTCKIVPYDIF